MNKKTIYWKLGYLVAAFGVFLIDQATKAWARKTLRFGDDVTVIPNFLNFIYAENTGVAFSQFADGGETGRWVLSGVAGLATAFVLYYFWRTPRDNDRLLGACAMLLAGIVGNLTDRVRLGYVIDFIDVQFGNWHYPTFNVADSAICIGAGLLILDLFFSQKQENAATEKQASASESSENLKSKI
ncbi:MAG: signal peptidase II [Acidobacteriota bacterium]|nr:signal peptidase II [Acidobacteriota bacterium]